MSSTQQVSRRRPLTENERRQINPLLRRFYGDREDQDRKVDGFKPADWFNVDEHKLVSGDLLYVKKLPATRQQVAGFYWWISSPDLVHA
ncbi:hypothetical protein GCM10028806_33800 [Spirosoma terrae]|uniref:Uncharacterized protein n=1 Tax=Spirosoma terrae TaxID=1968276 RepID=A0A6L9L8L0_9BACT|nr:hypothetical protein [Spirosoma terrae]NDU95692.1 hypothetical protein [Spirosoma terrae]